MREARRLHVAWCIRGRTRKVGYGRWRASADDAGVGSIQPRERCLPRRRMETKPWARSAPAAGPEADEEGHEPVDPHPDTPDDFDEDASSPRQSEEAVPEDDD